MRRATPIVGTVALGAAFAIAVAIAAWLIRPWVAVQVGFDSAASVIHFERLAAGQHLEAFVTTTPKPLFTVVFGVLHALGGWTLMAWSAIVVFGLLAVAAALLAWRTAGAAAAGFVTLGIGWSGPLLVETGYVYGVPWAALLWCLAGIAATGARPRYGVAGVALFLAALVRVETLVLVGLLAVVLFAAWVAGRMRGRRIVPPRAWLVLTGAAALPVMLVHDWLLTGNPWFWLTVSARYTEAAQERTTIAGPIEVATSIALRYVHQPGLVVLAVVGAIALLVARRWPVAVGLAGLGPGIAAFLVLLAARGTYVSSRYLAPVDVAVLFAAGIGVAALVDLGVAALRRRWPIGGWVVAGASVLVVAVALAVVAPPWGAAVRRAASTIASERALNGNAAFVEPAIAAALDTVPGSRAAPPPGAGVEVPSGRGPVLFVPPLLRPRLAVDLGLPLDRIAGLALKDVQAPAVTFTPGRIFYVDERGGHAGDAFGVLRIAQPATVGSARLVPLVADPRRRAWVVQVDAGGAP